MVCPIKHYTDKEKLSPKWVDNYCKSDWTKCIRFQKEENGIPHPDIMLPNGEIDESLLSKSE
jgi:hypothetical protein